MSLSELVSELLELPSTLECSIKGKDILIARIHRCNDIKVCRDADAVECVHPIKALIQVILEVYIDDRVLALAIGISIQELKDVSENACCISSVQFFDN